MSINFSLKIIENRVYDDEFFSNDLIEAELGNYRALRTHFVKEESGRFATDDSELILKWLKQSDYFAAEAMVKYIESIAVIAENEKTINFTYYVEWA